MPFGGGGIKGEEKKAATGKKEERIKDREKISIGSAFPF
jgi:hypothetical protein